MRIYALSNTDLSFPTSDMFDSTSDVIAIGGDLRPERLLLAYSQGIFPWYNHPSERLWWSPLQRCVLYFENLKISHSMRPILKQHTYRITMDTAFVDVLEGCSDGERSNNTWLIDEMKDAYTKLFEMGVGHSVEIWEGNQLVGGLYGLSLGKIFFGESMFSRKPNTSKLAFIMLSQFLQYKQWNLLDCQNVTDHLLSLGCSAISRDTYLNELNIAMQHPTQCNAWTDEFAAFQMATATNPTR